MSEGSSTLHWTLPPAQAVRVDQACNAFEMAWKTSSSAGGQRPQIEPFLEGFLSPEREALLRELILLDRTYRTQAGEKPTAEEYQVRFPAMAGEISAIFHEDNLPEQWKDFTALNAEMAPQCPVITEKKEPLKQE